MCLVISLVNLVGLYQMSAVVQVYVFSKIAISTAQNSEVKTLNVQFHAYTRMYMQSSFSDQGLLVAVHLKELNEWNFAT